jgi:membrane-associated protein
LSLLQTMLHLDQYLHIVIMQYGSLVYALLFAIVFCETALLVLFFLPGDPLLFISGAFCATGAMNIWILMALLFTAAVIGSIVNYWLGNAIGQKVFMQDYKWLNREALEKTHAFYEKHGGITFLLSPFIAVVRTFAPFVAGVSAMTFRKFQLFVVAGAALWVITLVSSGYFFGNIPVIRDHLNSIVLLGVGLGVGIPMLNWLWKFSKRRFAN